MHSKLAEKVRVSPNAWPEKTLDAQPGDMSLFVPPGLGLAGPFPLRPWDDLTTNPAQYYGFQQRTGHPLLDAPTNTACGGVVYFDDDREPADLAALCRLLAVNSSAKDYAVFLTESDNPQQDRYLVQLKIVSKFSLTYLFRALDEQEAAAFAEQLLTVGELLTAFIQDQQEQWGSGMSSELSGCMGGDGDWAKESLSFGFLVENDYHGVYRIWSRAWLVTK
ncbi:MAG: hypothetical protein U0872_06185 [Planctomycetaceae bacterium]